MYAIFKDNKLKTFSPKTPDTVAGETFIEISQETYSSFLDQQPHKTINTSGELVDCKIIKDSRLQAKYKKDADIQKITYDFSDGRVIQVRPDDVSNITIAIGKEYSGDWVMADNSIASVSTNDLKIALAYGISQGETIWQEYMDKLK